MTIDDLVQDFINAIASLVEIFLHDLFTLLAGIFDGGAE